ncbi:hypothetical protein BCV70DRAFT_158014, partial [Testicularia cyperi]
LQSADGSMGSLSDLKRWALPPFHQKQPWTFTNLWILAAPIPLLLLQVRLLMRADPRKTLLLRAGLIPIIALLAVRAGFSHYVTFFGPGQMEGGGQHMNLTFGIFGVFLCLLSLRWGLTTSRPRFKVHSPASTPKSSGNGATPPTKANGVLRPEPLPALFPGTWTPLEIDYFVNIRNIGWENGPKNADPALPLREYTAEERKAWLRPILNECVSSFVLLDALFAAIKDVRFNPTAVSYRGGSIWESQQGVFGIFNPWILCFTYAFGIFVQIQLSFGLAACVAVGLLGDRPSRWHSLPFSAPWRATSVQQLWSERWHQIFRPTFIEVAYIPILRIISPVLGKRVGQAAGVLASFTLSGLMHDLGQSAMTPEQGWSLTHTTTFFALQGVACVAERLFEQVSHRRVQGWLGWIWAMGFLTWTAPLLIDEWNKRGMLAAHDFTIGFTAPLVKIFFDVLS